MADAPKDVGLPSDRLACLVGRLPASAEKARAAGAWDRVEEIARDVLAVAPEDRRTADLLWRARLEQVPSGASGSW